MKKLTDLKFTDSKNVTKFLESVNVSNNLAKSDIHLHDNAYVVTLLYNYIIQ